ncbi:FKBP-type peptidyl-prolyl cis-trans isomerase N-terminal domain-containing protein, partial [Klebsiella pneumoniae]|uniref:FKBP-type peptidyl-prolyl cis-trans isomerase N-terminal domain-containing protein n=1 Tax=Klebsiella pneumoniae TaxID=573 RepID=UPI003D0100E8
RQNDQLRLSYAAGTALGNDIQELLNERKSWGLPVEKNSLLAGVIDSISGHLLLPQKELNTLKAQADSAAEAARQKQVTAEQ